MNRIRKTLNATPYREIIVFAIPALILLVVLGGGFVYDVPQQFSELAQAFLKGQLNFLHPIGGVGYDPVLWHGKVYWGEGPFPAVLLMPFVGFFSLFHLFFYQGYIQWALVLGALYFVFRLARILSFSKEDSVILALGFTLGSAFIGVAAIPSAWYFAQVVNTFLLLWSLYEFYTRKRWWLIGLICGCVLLTRVTAAPIFIFFGLELWQAVRSSAVSTKLVKVAQLYLPVAGALVLLGLYNFLRFHNPLNGGYEYQLIIKGSSQYKSRAYGVFSLEHVPMNLYTAILGTPTPLTQTDNSWILRFPYIKSKDLGMSIFITSPYLLYLFTQKWSSFTATARRLIVPIAVSALLVFSYYGVGRDQLGYRYSLDFLPEAFLLFMILYHTHHRPLSGGMKILLLGAGMFNFFLALSYVYLY